MAWTTPRTWTTGELVTASMMNTHVRDNLNETAAAKAAASGDIFYATGANAITALPKGTNGHVLTISAGLPKYKQPSNAFMSSMQLVSINLAVGVTSATTTIASIDTTRTGILLLGVNGQQATANDKFVYVELPSATQVKATRRTAGVGAPNVHVAVIEFRPGVTKSVQRGGPAVFSVGTTTVSVAITSVTMNRCWAMTTGHGEDSISGPNGPVDAFLTSATVLTLQKGHADVSVFAPWQVIEFEAVVFTSAP